MTLESQLKTVLIDDLTISPSAHTPYLISTFFQTLSRSTKLTNYSGVVDMMFESPYVYESKTSSYFMFANWSPLLTQTDHDQQEINVRVFQNLPKDIEKIAWCYLWHILKRGVHPDSAIDYAYKICAECPEKYRAHILDTGKTRETKAILEKHLGFGRQRARDAEARAIFQPYRNWDN